MIVTTIERKLFTSLHATLGLISSLPQITMVLFPLWFAVIRMDSYWLAALGLLSVPYLFKWAWAPLLDRWVVRFDINNLLMACHGAGWLIFGMLIFSAQQQHWYVMFVLAMLFAMLSASYDALVDGYRLAIEDSMQRARAVSAGVIGYRFGLVLVMVFPSGVLVAWLQWSWTTSLYCIWILYGLALMIYPKMPIHRMAPIKSSVKVALWGILQRLSFDFFVYLFLFKASLYVFEMFIAKYLSSYAHFSIGAISFWQQAIGLAMVFVGCVWMPQLIARYSSFRLAQLLALSQLALTLGWCLVHPLGSYFGIVVLLCLEHLIWGGMNIFLMTLLMSFCLHEYRISQYSFLFAVTLLPKVFLGFVASWFINHYSWMAFFDGLFILSALLVLWLQCRKRSLDKLIQSAFPLHTV